MNTIKLVDMVSLNPTTEIVVINSEITKGSDLLLTTTLDDAACNTVPETTDNDFRGPDPDVPFADERYNGYISSRLNPDAPVFAKLPDGGYAIHDYRLEFDENTLERYVNG